MKLLLLLLVLGRFYLHSRFKGLNFKNLVCKDNFKFNINARESIRQYCASKQNKNNFSTITVNKISNERIFGKEETILSLLCPKYTFDTVLTWQVVALPLKPQHGFRGYNPCSGKA